MPNSDMPIQIVWAKRPMPSSISTRWRVDVKTSGRLWWKSREYAIESVETGMRLECLDAELIRFFSRMHGNILIMDNGEAARIGL